MVVKNLMAVPITIAKGMKVVWVGAKNVVPPVELASRTFEALDETQDIKQTEMLVERRKEVFLQ